MKYKKRKKSMIEKIELNFIFEYFKVIFQNAEVKYPQQCILLNGTVVCIYKSANLKKI